MCNGCGKFDQELFAYLKPKLLCMACGNEISPGDESCPACGTPCPPKPGTIASSQPN
ncbi:MAG: zinc-ribbon domain-containing protein [Coriobacteriales bacterium]|nr:zinc-ribbon domain-containing protein [Coriobacteriales bacterium]